MKMLYKIFMPAFALLDYPIFSEAQSIIPAKTADNALIYI